MGWAVRSGLIPQKKFLPEHTPRRIFLICMITLAPLTSNMSLLHNSVASYQLCKILQTPVGAASSPTRSTGN